MQWYCTCMNLLKMFVKFGQNTYIPILSYHGICYHQLRYHQPKMEDAVHGRFSKVDGNGIGMLMVTDGS